MHRQRVQLICANRLIPCVAIALSGAWVFGCSHHITVDPIKVEPIYLNVDVNLRLDHELEQSFGFENRIEQQVQSSPATAPAPPPPPVNNAPGEK